MSESARQNRKYIIFYDMQENIHIQDGVKFSEVT